VPSHPHPFARGTTDGSRYRVYRPAVLLIALRDNYCFLPLRGGPKTDLFGPPADPRSPPTLLAAWTPIGPNPIVDKAKQLTNVIRDFPLGSMILAACEPRPAHRRKGATSWRRFWPPGREPASTILHARTGRPRAFATSA